MLLASSDRFQLQAPNGHQPPFGGAVTSPEGYLLALWVHECQRVFVDKMNTAQDKAWTCGIIDELVR